MQSGFEAGHAASAQAVVASDCHLSLVIPARNEETRLGETLAAVLETLAAKPFDSEVWVVLDGCTDQTAAVARRWVGVSPRVSVQVLENPIWQGKGACVRQGMLRASGRYRFFTDADLSYPLYQLDGFLDVLEKKGGVVIASRTATSASYQTFARRLVTRLSRGIVSRFFVRGIADSQAGLKGFSAECAHDLFSNQRTGGFGFDVEILHIARLRDYPIEPLAVEWVDRPGSTVRLSRDLMTMALELVAIAAHRLLGRYRHRVALPEPGSVRDE